MLDEQIEDWAPRVGVARACRAFGTAERSWHHRRQRAEGRARPRPSRAKAGPRKTLSWQLTTEERAEILEVLCRSEYCDLAPAQVYTALLDQGRYLCSERTMYRLLADQDLNTGDRRRGHQRRSHPVPEVEATGPNTAWSWDISRLKGPKVRDWFYLYVLLDIYSRMIVGWTIDAAESDAVAKRLIETTCDRQGIKADQLVLHSDRGAQMTSNTIAELLEDLSVTRSLSRPRTSNDNPYSEANFKTVKYRPDYPDRFQTIKEANTWMRDFVDWYNHHHYHSGIAYLHPADVHYQRATPILQARQAVLDTAYETNPGRFRRRPPQHPELPAKAWINKPTIKTKT